MKQHTYKIDEDNPQVIYDALFMSESEFGLIYGELYQSYRLAELRAVFQRVREKVIEGGLEYPRHLKKTKLSMQSFKDVRETQGAISIEVKPEDIKVKKEEEPEPLMKTTSLKEEIIKLHQANKTKTEIRDALGCKYQYVFQTVKKYEDAKKVDS